MQNRLQSPRALEANEEKDIKACVEETTIAQDCCPSEKDSSTAETCIITPAHRGSKSKSCGWELASDLSDDEEERQKS